MTTQFGDSLEIQGKVAHFSSATDLSSANDMAVSDPPVKKKRGRPRKAIPLDVLMAARSAQKSVGPETTEKSSEAGKKSAMARRGRKKRDSRSAFVEDDFFDLDEFGAESPFFEDELSTLDEFEHLAKIPSGRTTGEGSRKRVDRPSGTPTPVTLPKRKKVVRRRQIDPATCERDYTADEIEFMNALSEYKRSSGRMFPTCSEILEVLRGLGYEKHGES